MESTPDFHLHITVNHINVSFPLGKMIFAQTSVEGLNLVQDPITGRWETIKSGRGLSAFARLKLRYFGPAKSRTTFKVNLGIAFAVCALGVGTTIFFSWAPMQTGRYSTSETSPPKVVIKPGLPSQEAPSVPASITVDSGAYVEQRAESSDPLPPPMSLQVPQAVIPQPMPAPAKLSTTVPPIAPTAPPVNAKAPQAKAEESNPISVFNEPLPLLKSPLTMLPSPATSGQVQAVQAAKPVQPTKTAIRILAIPENNSVVVTDPSTRLPLLVKVGEALPDGTTLKSVDKANSSALTSRGESISLQ